jgi:hypothetical protein
VIGMSASSDPSVKSWFGSSLVQANYFFGVAKWSSIKSTSSQVLERTIYAYCWELIELTHGIAVVLTFLKLRSTLQHAILDPHQTIKRISTPYSRTLTSLPHAIANIQPWSVASEHVSTMLREPRLQEIDEDDDVPAARQPSHASTTPLLPPSSPPPKFTRFPPTGELLDHEMRALDQNFHKVMFDGDFWFTDQDDPASASASSSSGSSPASGWTPPSSEHSTRSH